MSRDGRELQLDVSGLKIRKLDIKEIRSEYFSPTQADTLSSELLMCFVRNKEINRMSSQPTKPDPGPVDPDSPGPVEKDDLADEPLPENPPDEE